VREECAKKLEAAKQQEARLQEKIATLEKKNALLEFELKRRTEPEKK